MITEDGIRDALEHGASQAPGPDRVLTGLHARIRTARRRRAAAVAVGTAAIAITVPVATTTGLPFPDRDDGAVTGSPAAGTLYGPTWLPSGIYETVRSVSSWPGPERYERVWTFGPAAKATFPESFISLSVAEDGDSPLDPLPPSVTWNETLAPPGQAPGTDEAGSSPRPGGHDSGQTSRPPGIGTEETKVNGHSAVRERSRNMCAVSWRPSPKQLLTVMAHVMGDNCLVASRVANSLVKDPSATVTDAIRVGRTPEGHGVRSRLDIRAPFSGCVARVYIGPADPTADPPAPSPADQVEYGHGALPDGGTPLTVAGRPARYYERLVLESAPLQVVAIDLGDGRRLLVGKNDRTPVPKATLVEFAGQISVGRPPTCNWGRL